MTRLDFDRLALAAIEDGDSELAEIYLSCGSIALRPNRDDVISLARQVSALGSSRSVLGEHETAETLQRCEAWLRQVVRGEQPGFPPYADTGIGGNW